MDVGEAVDVSGLDGAGQLIDLLGDELAVYIRAFKRSRRIGDLSPRKFIKI